jgi:Arc/MetJ family transcription regulator
MHTKIDLDDELLKEAFRHVNVSTTKELVHLALRELIASRRRMDVRELQGQGGIRPGYDYKRLRAEEP